MALVSGPAPKVPEEASAQLNIRVRGLKPKGQLLIALFNQPEGFPGKAERAVRKAKVPVSDREVLCTFDRLAPGTYAFIVVHDENSDGKLNTNWLGIPTEGYVASRGERGTMGPPQYSKAQFPLPVGLHEETVLMKY